MTVLCLPSDKSDSKGVVDSKFPQCFLQNHKTDFNLSLRICLSLIPLSCFLSDLYQKQILQKPFRVFSWKAGVSKVKVV